MEEKGVPFEPVTRPLEIELESEKEFEAEMERRRGRDPVE